MLRLHSTMTMTGTPAGLWWHRAWTLLAGTMPGRLACREVLDEIRWELGIKPAWPGGVIACAVSALECDETTNLPTVMTSPLRGREHVEKRRGIHSASRKPVGPVVVTECRLRSRFGPNPQISSSVVPSNLRFLAAIELQPRAQALGRWWPTETLKLRSCPKGET